MTITETKIEATFNLSFFDRIKILLGKKPRVEIILIHRPLDPFLGQPLIVSSVIVNQLLVFDLHKIKTQKPGALQLTDLPLELRRKLSESQKKRT